MQNFDYLFFYNQDIIFLFFLIETCFTNHHNFSYEVKFLIKKKLVNVYDKINKYIKCLCQIKK